jgi:hypothetical protein
VLFLRRVDLHALRLAHHAVASCWMRGAKVALNIIVCGA